MKKLTVSIGSLGSAAAGDYVSFNIWQGKRLLVSDKIAGKHSGTFHREYDVDYTQGEPLRIESNAPAGCSVGVNVAPSDDAVAYINTSAGKIVIHKQNGDVACVMGPLVTENKTIEQRVADLEKQLADTISPSDAASIMEIVSAETDRIIREKNMIGFSADIAFMANAKLNSEYVFIADQITPDDDDVKVNVRITGRQTPDLSLFWVPVLVDKVDGASLKYYEDQGVIAAKKMIIDISKAAAL